MARYNRTQNEVDKFVETPNGQAIRTADLDLILLLDDTTTADAIYVGKAAIGSATSASAWQIRKLDTSSGLTIKYAGGVAGFTNKWDSRASYTYS